MKIPQSQLDRCSGKNSPAGTGGGFEPIKEKDFMSTLKHALLIGACAAAAAVAAAPSSASTKSPSHLRSPRAATQVWGGGSSLISGYLRQAMNCYGLTEQLIVRGPPVSLKTIQPFNYTGTPPFDCSSQTVNSNADMFVDSASSGVGIANVFSHDPTSSSPNGYGDIDPNTTGEQDMPYVSYGLSDAGLSSTDVGYYINGNDDQGTTNPCSTAVQEQGVCVVGHGETAHPPTTYPNPQDTRGAMIQFPMSVDPVAFAYDPVYKKVADNSGNVTTYSFHIAHPHSDGSGGLRFDAATYCKIWNGQITNWNDPALKSLNANQSLQDPSDPDGATWWKNTGVGLQIAGRLDKSGTTSIFTRHLASVCASYGFNQYTDGATTLPLTLQGGTYDGTNALNEQLGKFEMATGSGLVAQYVAFRAVPANGQELTQGHIAYLGADFVLPAVQVSGQNAWGLNSADLKNSSGHWEPATGAAALIGFGSLAPPQSDNRGHYDLTSCSGASARCRTHPYDWAEPIFKSSPLANPTAKNAYPVIGTTNIIAYTCYSNAKVATTLRGFINWYVGSGTVQQTPLGLLSQNGLSPLPSAWRTAIRESFFSGADGLNLQIEPSGTGVCAGVTGG